MGLAGGGNDPTTSTIKTCNPDWVLKSVGLEVAFANGTLAKSCILTSLDELVMGAYRELRETSKRTHGAIGVNAANV